MARTTVVSIGNANAQTTPGDPLLADDSAPEYTLTFPSAIPAGVEAGDTWADGDPSDYLVQSISADRITVVVLDKATGAGGSPTLASSGNFSRTYSAIGTADTGASTWSGIASGDTYAMEMHEEGANYAGTSQTISNARVGTSGTMKLSVPASEWHKGVAGAGFVWDTSAGDDALTIAPSSGVSPEIIVERLEMTGGVTGATATRCIRVNEDDPGKVIVRDCIGHGWSGTGVVIGIYVGAAADDGVKVENCLMYDSTSSGADRGIWCDGDGVLVSNCTVHGFGTAGILDGGAATGTIVKNCVCVGNGTDFALGGGAFGGASTNNASEDGTAPDTNEQTATDADFVDVAGGDFNIVVGSALKRTGTDIGLTTDIRGKQIGSVPNIGAYGTQFAGIFLPVIDD